MVGPEGSPAPDGRCAPSPGNPPGIPPVSNLYGFISPIKILEINTETK